jgi:site-specific DNA recombinase
MPSDETNNPTRAALYARVSTDLQSADSIEDQLRICAERAAKEGWQVVESYIDQGISGASLIRPGIQKLLQDAVAGKLDIILTESLDRVSRDQEDIAHVYKRMRFLGTRIVTLSEGEVNELHVGLKGTMGALYLKDLADKTRRGLRGRIEAGKSGGGNSYGYDVVKKIGDNGEPVRGERRINPQQAAIVKRIFKDYARGVSPRAIAKQLNREGVPGPSGKGWGPSTIHGNWQRGTGILNNELYIGRQVWNRLRFIKDPQTGKRISRFNPQSEWIIRDVPELRIIDQDLWDQVKARQGALQGNRSRGNGPGYWDRRRPRYLFTGLMRCGVCGGGVATWNRLYVGCVNARNKGTCTNKTTVRRDDLEAAVLEGLQHRLMDPDLMGVFCEEYTRHINALTQEHNAAREGAKAELARVNRDLDRLVQALLDGAPARTVKDRMAQLEARKDVLEAELAQGEDVKVAMHPSMASIYRERVANLRDALAKEGCQAEAAEIMRTLIDRIELTPVLRDGKGTLSITLHGDLAGILGLAAKAKGPLDASGPVVECTKLVAGARNHLCRTLMAWALPSRRAYRQRFHSAEP